MVEGRVEPTQEALLVERRSGEKLDGLVLCGHCEFGDTGGLEVCIWVLIGKSDIGGSRFVSLVVATFVHAVWCKLESRRRQGLYALVLARRGSSAQKG